MPKMLSHTARNTGIGIVVALLLYVLSFGPVLRLTIQGKISEGFRDKIYAPLFWLDEHDKTITAPILEWYIAQWCTAPFSW